MSQANTQTSVGNAQNTIRPLTQAEIESYLAAAAQNIGVATTLDPDSFCRVTVLGAARNYVEQVMVQLDRQGLKGSPFYTKAEGHLAQVVRLSADPLAYTRDGVRL